MMLSRGLSNASTRSAAPGSLTCVQTNSLAPQENHGKDLEGVQRQAIAAASFAFERASERALGAQGPKESNIGQAARADEQLGMGQPLARKQSIRFTGLTANPIRRRSITRRVAPENDISNLPDGAKMGSYLRGRCFADRRVSDTRNSPWNNGNSRESHVFASSASLWKLQAARSMFTLRGSATNSIDDNRPSQNFQVRQNPASPRNEHSQLSDGKESRLRRSFSFLRGEKDHIAPRLDTLKNQSGAAQLARKQYLRDVEERSLKGNSSSSALGYNHKPQKAFRRSVRSSSINSHRGAIGAPAQATKESALKKGLGYKARSLSSSLKKKLKHVFQRPSDVKDTIPVQQLDASRLHFGEYPSKYTGANQGCHQIPSPDGETLRKARSRESSLGEAPDFLENGSSTKNIRSVRVEEGASHLFASWANPLSGHILAATQSGEKKRLSVQEHGGLHQPSSNNHNFADLGKVLFAPIRTSSAGKQIENSIDSRKIYSALQQEIDDNRCLAQLHGYFREKEKTDDGVEATISEPQRDSLRAQSLHSILLESPSPDHGIETTNLAIVEPIQTSSMNNEIHRIQNRSSDYSVQEEFFDMYTSLTHQQSAVQDETNDTCPRRPLRESKAAFPSSTNNDRSNVSPYRRVMGFDGGDETGTRSKLEEDTPIGSRSESGFRSASVYSRTSGGNTPRKNMSSASLTKFETSHERGRSIMKILQSPPGESLAPLTRQREFPNKSKDCQGWMDPGLFEPENRWLGDVQNFSAAGKENHYKKEITQIDDEDMDGSRLRDDIYMKKPGFGISFKLATPQLSLRQHASGSIFRRSPLLEIGQSATPGRPEQCSSSSPCQPSTPHRSLCLDQETPSFGRNNQRPELLEPTAPGGTPKSQGSDPLANRDGGMLRHDLSISAENIRIDTTRDMRETPTPAPIRAGFRTTRATKSQGYNSPERLARTRRLQSSNSLASRKKWQVEPNTRDDEKGQDNKVIGAAFQDTLRIGGVMNQSISNTACEEAVYPGARSMVDYFLSTRRKPEVNEENGIGQAFL